MVSFYWASMGGREHEANQRGKKRNVHISQQHRNQAVLHSIHRGLSYDIFIIHLPSLYFAFTIGSDINIQLAILYTVYIFIALMFLSCLVEVPYFYYRCLLSLLFMFLCLPCTIFNPWQSGVRRRQPSAVNPSGRFYRS